MRIIDVLAVRAGNPVPPAELRAAGATTEVVADQVRTHYIALARYLADIGAHTDMSNLRASEAREVERRRKVIAELRAALPAPITLHQARWALVNRKEQS